MKISTATTLDAETGSALRYDLYKERAVLEARIRTLDERICVIEAQNSYDLHGIDDKVFHENLPLADRHGSSLVVGG